MKFKHNLELMKFLHLETLLESKIRNLLISLLEPESKNILIEFKEYKSELRNELRKPLRKKLCYNLTEEISLLSRRCHFAAWNENENEGDININLVPYIDEVCKRFNLSEGVKNLLVENQIDSHEIFITNFVNNDCGVSYTEFKKYINYLSDIAQQKNNHSFEAVLFSRNNSGKLKATKFSNLDELLELIELNPPR